MSDVIVMLSNDEKAQRAEKLATELYQPTIWYFLDTEKGIRNGGRDPRAADCATHWKDGNGVEWATGDCVSLVVWSGGYSRRMELFDEYEDDQGRGAINTDSMLLDANSTSRTKRHLYRKLAAPVRGCVITMPSLRDARGKRLSPGHTGRVVRAGADLASTLVAHCSPRHHAKYKRAIAITAATIFGSRDGWSFLSDDVPA